MPRIPVFGDNITDSLYYSREGARFLTVGDSDPSYPSVEKADRWAGVKFYFAVRVDPAGCPRGRPAHGPNAVAPRKEDRRGPRAAARLRPGQSDQRFPAAPGLRALSSTRPRATFPAWKPASVRDMVDSFLELRTAKEQSVGVEVIDPDGKRPLSLKEAATAQSFQLTRAGFYQLRLANGRQDFIGVNADRRESDLDVIPRRCAVAMDAEMPRNRSAGSYRRRSNPGPEKTVWPVVVCRSASTGCALAESLLSSQYLRYAREEL